jgi:hypothetical protein
MHSLTELKEYLIQQEIQIKEFGGWYLKVGKDTWTMLDGVYYCNGAPQKIKDKSLFDNYKRKTQNGSNSTQTRNWRGIGSGSLLRDGNDD